MWLTSQLRLLAISDDMNRMEIGASLSFILKILVVTSFSALSHNTVVIIISNSPLDLEGAFLFPSRIRMY